MRTNKIVCCIAAALLMLAVPAISDAGKSDKSDKSDKSGKSAKRLNCKTSGTWLNGDNADQLVSAAGTFAAASVGKCNRGFGQVGTLGLAELVGAGSAFNCVALASAPAGGATSLSPSTIFNKKGDSLLYEIAPGTPADQCFFAADGVTAVVPGPFCGDPLTTSYFSTSVAPFTIVSGTGKFAGATGGGTFTSEASHCGIGPVGNFVKSELKGGTDPAVTRSACHSGTV